MLKRFPSARNFGAGKTLRFAVRNALRIAHCNGHFNTCSTHASRAERFVRHLEDVGIRDFREVDLPVLDDYACIVTELVADRTLEPIYGKNLISTANVILEVLRSDRLVKVSPACYLGRLCRIRQTPPTGLSPEVVVAASDELYRIGFEREAACVLLARSLGMRMRETLLADIPRLCKEIESVGACNIQEGTKGRRRAPRWVEADEMALRGLAIARSAKTSNSRNLLAESETFIDAVRGSVRKSRSVLKSFGIDTFHDLRASFACERYQQLTGLRAPILGGPRFDARAHGAEMKRLSNKMGHGRVDVLRSYVG